MLDIGFQELILILVIALLVFGPRKLPELGRALGRAMREFRRASDEFRSTIETNLQINEPDPVPTPVMEAPEPAETVEASAGSLSASAPDLFEAAVAEPGEPFLAQRGSRLFHSRECGWAGRIPEAERSYFKRVSEAREAGFEPCPVCEPRDAG